MNDFDIAIIGAGIVGLATAYQIQKNKPRLKIVIIEKESSQGLHQTGHNSGVLHSGIYYKPGSKKALNCRLGRKELQEFCDKESIPFELCGKVIVATNEQEAFSLHKIFAKGQSNQVECHLINKSRLKELEPHCEGVEAIHVPECGIIDYKAVCRVLVNKLLSHGSCEILFGHKVLGLVQKNGVILKTSKNAIRAKYLINCSGLYSDKIATMALARKAPAKIIPFKGEYYELINNKHLCKNLIYPVPDIKYPFLGVHFTRMINGKIECGPNAVLAFGREAYVNWDVQFYELFEALFYEGFIKMAYNHWPTGIKELWRSFNKKAFVKALQKLIPEIKAEDLVVAPAGIRAQAIKPDGELVDDFLIVQEKNMIHVLNAPSPAATSSFQIGKSIFELLLN